MIAAVAERATDWCMLLFCTIAAPARQPCPSKVLIMNVAGRQYELVVLSRLGELQVDPRSFVSIASTTLQRRKPARTTLFPPCSGL